MSDRTVVSDVDIVTDAHIVITPLSASARQQVQAVQLRLAQAFPPDALWLPDGDQLHLTFVHITTPEVRYTEPVSDLYTRVSSQAIAALERAISSPVDIAVTFDCVEVHPGAVIIKGHDQGEYAALRQKFIANFILPKGTRQPPTIIHSTVARFRQELDLDAVRACMAGFPVSFVEHVTSFELINETKIFVQAHTLLQRFPEQSAKS